MSEMVTLKALMYEWFWFAFNYIAEVVVLCCWSFFKETNVFILQSEAGPQPFQLTLDTQLKTC